MWAKQAINDKLQGSVPTYFRCGGVVNNQIRKGLLLSLSVNFVESVNIWQRYKQERDCLVHFLRLLAVCWPGAQSAWDNHALTSWQRHCFEPRRRVDALRYTLGLRVNNYKQVCVQLPTYADNVALPAFARSAAVRRAAIDRDLLPVGPHW